MISHRAALANGDCVAHGRRLRFVRIVVKRACNLQIKYREVFVTYARVCLTTDYFLGYTIVTGRHPVALREPLSPSLGGKSLSE